MNAEFIGDPKMAMICYKNVLGEELQIPKRLEETIGTSTVAPFMWMEALVGDQQKMPEYRDCVDCKMGETHIKHLPPQFMEMKNIYNDTVERLVKCLRDYESRYNIRMDYMEAINYVRYGVGQHFGVHSDHGFSYNCTVSSVMYLNDGYEGGELWFPFLDVTYVPSLGDIVFFPSTYLYAHCSKPVLSGTKYAAVTMFDYNDRTHRQPYGHNIDGTPATPGAGIPRYTSEERRFMIL